MAAVLKTAMARKRHRGFESHALRQRCSAATKGPGRAGTPMQPGESRNRVHPVGDARIHRPTTECASASGGMFMSSIRWRRLRVLIPALVTAAMVLAPMAPVGADPTV